MAARCSWLFGAGRVIVIDHIDYRLEFAQRYAPAEVYNFRLLRTQSYSLRKRQTPLERMSVSTRSGVTPPGALCTLCSVRS
jgi:hypothetical protein